MTDSRARRGHIVRVETFPVRLRFTEPEVSAKGSRTSFENVIIRLETVEGIVGWGEASGSTTGAPVEAVHAVIERTRPLLEGLSVFDTGELRRRIMVGGRLTNVVRLGHLACAGYDLACWDAAGKLANLPVAQLIGGRVRESVNCFAYSMKVDPDRVAADAAAAAAAGFAVVYVKVGFDRARDLALLEIRATVGDDVRIRVDANEGWTLPEARTMIKGMSRFDVEFVEAPIDGRNLSGMRDLRLTTDTPIAANEGIWSLPEAAEAIRHGACDVVVVGPLWLGGLLQVREMASLCDAHGVGYCLHAPPSSAIAMAASLQVLATIPRLGEGNQTYHLGHVVDDVCSGLHALGGGGLQVPAGPGLGIEVDEDRVRSEQSRP
jgi:L-alanine-DL-glutamate epimerase-like enolase superfamily enzyme